uniref:(northern house mosquito) hypothetical protein n=1 Tax=Culex pipiens TaxID=7175 RepID=A0A8D8I299_CULPI
MEAARVHPPDEHHHLLTAVLLQRTPDRPARPAAHLPVRAAVRLQPDPPGALRAPQPQQHTLDADRRLHPERSDHYQRTRQHVDERSRDGAYRGAAVQLRWGVWLSFGVFQNVEGPREDLQRQEGDVRHQVSALVRTVRNSTAAVGTVPLSVDRLHLRSAVGSFRRFATQPDPRYHTDREREELSQTGSGLVHQAHRQGEGIILRRCRQELQRGSGGRIRTTQLTSNA